MPNRSPTVLVVEDVEETYERFSDFLAQAGYSVLGASDGYEAVEMATRVAPDVILMDLSLPRCNGLEATRRIKSQPRTRHIPVLAVSGHSEQRVLALAERVGCDGFLAKPCALTDVLDEIRRFVPTPGPGRRVMLVEDDDDVRVALAGVLQDEGFTVDEARHGREALERLGRSELPSLILLDLMMPVMDGWAFRAAQRADTRLAKIPVVVLTALPDAHLPPLDATEVLRKPLDVPRLLDTVDRVGHA